MAFRSRAWVFTINNYTDDDCMNVVDLSARYIVFSFEVGEQGTPHIQGYVYYHEARTRNSVSKDLPRARLAVAAGSHQQNHDYVEKSGDYAILNQPPNQIWEFGEVPQQGRARWEKIKEVMKDPKENPHLFQQYYKTYKTIKALTKKEHEREIYVIKTKDRFEVAKKFKSSLFDQPNDTYEDEEAIFISAYSTKDVINWYNGYPNKFRRGYEVVSIDPKAYVIMYDDFAELNYIHKQLGDITPEHFDL